MKSSYVIIQCVSLLLIVTITGCASPNVWVQARTPNAGIIGYQNYNPRSDNGKRIEDLIPCPNGHRMTLNTQRSQATGAVGYMKFDDMILPTDSGVVNWAEYHYECLERKISSLSTASEQSESKEERLIRECNTGMFYRCLDLASFYIGTKDLKNEIGAWSKACQLKNETMGAKACWTAASMNLNFYFNHEAALPSLETGCSFKNQKPTEKEVVLSCGYFGALKNDKKLFRQIEPSLGEVCESGTQNECYAVARMYSKIGLQSESLKHLRKSKEKGFSNISHIMKTPDLKSLRSTPQFTKFMEEFAERGPSSK